ncbi:MULTISPECIES: nicotinamide-nucleotide adenylyltransferase [Acidiplasma]|jgi:nicotinamide-nucleotide adenylyltransferase|uniref:Nicotinamide-nucleotide adenylyltransferase n=2 Tax=Acidiplasma TaxID=507753 RepID=A0A0Q0RTX2_9ARCH|nr:MULTISPECIES: nicotinamide-nucleotide adenylyltransferase [Acidiplasma]KJE49171.1 nicotinamide-nucleotide adenylyltransferase [Acidiplasma sp. MBA-1]KQB35805.1 nicotinamide-nucleotide adenylyltransferase [Acidiplasma cupricumulans]KQB36004.1 nicotinamide-nucleotide adenylyltransferase [Acidiplasma aeolicum]WMT54884.1 MAG: nicotinamide-nucleotide adenylyltransferase [Acidiplasma sp.]
MTAFIIGRFQPFHKGHLEIIKTILKDNDHVIIGIGSAQFSHTLTNPFTAGERYLMISNTLEANNIKNFYIVPIEDVNSNPMWVAHVESLTPPFSRVYTNNPLVKRLFYEKKYEVRSLPLLNRKSWSGTRIREKMIKGLDWKDDVPETVYNIITNCLDGINRIRELANTDEDPI